MGVSNWVLLLKRQWLNFESAHTRWGPLTTISGFIPSYTHLQPWLNRVCWGYNYLITRGAPSCTVDGCWWLKSCTTCYLWNRMKKWDQLPFPQLVSRISEPSNRRNTWIFQICSFLPFCIFFFWWKGTYLAHLEDPGVGLITKIGTQHEVGFKHLGNLSYTGFIHILVLFVTCLRKKIDLKQFFEQTSDSNIKK